MRSLRKSIMLIFDFTAVPLKQLSRSTHEVLQILSISLTDKTHLRDLFESTNDQYDKDRCDLEGQLFIDF